MGGNTVSAIMSNVRPTYPRSLSTCEIEKAKTTLGTVRQVCPLGTVIENDRVLIPQPNASHLSGWRRRPPDPRSSPFGCPRDFAATHNRVPLAVRTSHAYRRALHRGL